MHGSKCIGQEWVLATLNMFELTLASCKNPQNLATREGVVMEYGVEVDSKTVFLLPMGMDRKNRCMGSSV